MLTLLPAGAMLAACAAPPDPSPEPPAPEPCGAAWSALVADLGATFASTDTTVEFPPREAFVARCAASELDPAQLACLNPRRATAAPRACALALAPARDRVDALAAWFDAETRIAAAPHQPSAPGASP